MKKTLLTALFALGMLAGRQAAAQYYIVPNLTAGQNPAGLNTDNELVYGSLPGWNLLVTGDANTQATPVWSGVQTLPFAFQLNGQSFTTYKVSSSGVLTFSTGATAVPPVQNASLPSADIPNNSVCMWGTLLTANSDYLLSKTFGTAPNRQHWVQFNSATIPFPTGTTNAPIPNSLLYCSIVLEEGTNKVYMVWQRSSAQPQTMTAGIQIDANTAVQVAASPAVSVPNLGDATPADNAYYEFGVGTQPALDLAARTLALPNSSARPANITIQGEFVNQGTQTINSVTVNYRVANGPVVSATLNGYTAAPQSVSNFVHPTRWQPTAGGVIPVKVWLSMPNGSPDQNPANDTARTTVVVADSTMQRTVVEEVFTSSTCGPCRLGNANTTTVNGQAANRGKSVEIKYQQNFPAPGNDPYYTAESGARFGYYSGSYIPYMLLDGSWNQNSQSFTTNVLNQYRARPGFVRLGGSYQLQNGVLSASATVKPLLSIPAGRLVAHMVVTERHTVLNARTNGETVFYDVMKKMLPNQLGTPLPALTSGQTYNLSQLFTPGTLPASQAVEHFDSLRVVVFVQDLVTKEIYQGAYLTLRTPLATRNAQAGPAVSLYPNPTTGRTTLAFALARPETVRVEVLDMLGRDVLRSAPRALAAGAQELALDLTHQAAGLYTVRLTTAAGVSTSKLMLQ